MLIALLLSSSLLNDAIPITIASSLDYASTRYALTQCSNCYEFNPVERKSLLIAKIVTTAGTIVITREMRKKSPKAAKIFKYSIIAIWSGVTVNNILRGRNAKP